MYLPDRKQSVRKSKIYYVLLKNRNENISEDQKERQKIIKRRIENKQLSDY